jgi:hypothetical protein
LQWYTDPDAAVLLELHANKPQNAPVLTLADPQQSGFALRLYTELEARELEADACFACHYWQPLRLHTDEQLPAGRCRWHNTESAVPDALSTQSSLSLACNHFQRNDRPPSLPVGESSPGFQHARVPKAAELDPDRLPFWPRLLHRLRGRKTTVSWTDQIIERSGVGAGTEPCFICKGRLANLGALVVESQEGDKQTLSVWRCRICYTTYFNDWTDRWERLDNLETEEIYYRIAPAEAYTALLQIHNTQGGDHPGRRQDRSRQRTELLALVSGIEPLSHQIRQGR